ncbi:girdin-like isoform X3 [Mya arenaria]|uniref:girdin-like isoform X3 n=1 Tax=Mya arenaria TaxID=6604 RepID=UPI0022E7C11D|nr:girdin-like isoform X3 [Mya arenaria]
MSFLSCIGKKSKKKKGGKNELLDRKMSSAIEEQAEEVKENIENTHKSAIEHITAGSRKSSKSSLSKPGPSVDHSKTLLAEKDRLEADLTAMRVENQMHKDSIERLEHTMTSYTEDIKRLEDTNVDLKSRVTRAETEAAKVTIENQKLLQKIVGVEERQAMMSRAELQSMISQLEEAEAKAASKPAAELSGIRTNPAAPANGARKRSNTAQEEKQISWSPISNPCRLSRTEARLSQSLDENRRLREDLKDMLDSQIELQQSIVSDALSSPIDDILPRSMSAYGRLNTSGSDSEVQTDEQDTDVVIARLGEAELENQRLRLDYSALEQAFNDLQKRLDELERMEKIKSETDENAKEDSTQTHSIDDDNELEMMLSKLENNQKHWQMENEKLIQTCASLSSRIDTVCQENSTVREEHDFLTRKNTDYTNELEKKTKEIEGLLNEINNSKDENKRLQEECRRLGQQLQKRKDTVARPSGSLETVERELSDVKQKLKEISSMKGTPPTKSLDLNPVTPASLAERFRSELYDREWRQAFAYFTERQRRDEKKTIQILGEICTEAYLFTKRAARMQQDTMTSSLVTPTSHQYRSTQVNKRNGHLKALTDQLPDDLRRRLAHFRCRPSQELLERGVHDFLNQIDYDRTRFLRHVSERDFHDIMSYVRLCFELSWCMAVQEPPMYLLFKVKHGLDIDPERFDRYQATGKRVDYIIWPAVFTIEGGACLQKGVAYALPER